MSCCKTITKAKSSEKWVTIAPPGTLSHSCWWAQSWGIVRGLCSRCRACSAHTIPAGRGDITCKELLAFPAEESVRADLPAGWDLPFVVQAERVSACAQTRAELSGSCLPDSPSECREPNQPRFPSPHTLTQTWACRRAAAGKELPCSERRLDPKPSSGFPTWTGTPGGTGNGGAASAEGVTGYRWDLGLLWGQRWRSPHHTVPPQGPTGRARVPVPWGDTGGWHSVAPREQQWPPQASLLCPTALCRDQTRHRPPEKSGSAEFVPQVGLSGPTPCAHTGQEAAVTQWVWHPGGWQRCRALREANQHCQHS